MADVGQADELEVVTPVEYQNRRIVRYFGYKLESFSAAMLLDIIRNRMFAAKIPEIWEDNGMLFYQYPGKPLIIIKDGQFFTTKETWTNREFSHREIMHQASIILRILHGHKLASYNRKAILKKSFTPYKFRKAVDST